MNRNSMGLSALLALFLAANAAAEGFRLYGMSADGQMRGEALVASDEGPDANWYNPAALVTIEPKSMVSGGLNLLVVNAKYTSTTGESVKNNDTVFPLPSVYYAQKICDRLAVGLGMNTPFGLSTDYTDPTFKYITTGGKVELINISPNAALKVTDTLFFGAGVNYYRSTTELRQVVPYTLTAGQPDSPLKVEGEGDGFGLNTGLLWKMSDTQKLGVTYKSEVTIDYTGGKAHLDRNPFTAEAYETGVQTRIRFPDMVGMGWSFQPAKRWDVEIGGQWTNWADMKKLEVRLDEQTAFLTNATTQLDWKNTWTARVGGTYGLNDLWKLSGGYFYTTSPTRESTYTPLVPDGNHHVFSVGGTYNKGSLTVGIPLVLILQTGTSDIQNNVTDVSMTQNVNGKYELMGYQLGLSASWKF